MIAGGEIHWEVSTKRGFGPMEGDLSYTMTERDSSLQNCTIRCNRIALPECRVN